MVSPKPYIISFFALILLAVAAVKIMAWVRDHPQHFASQPFELDHPIGWASRAKLVALSQQDETCFSMMDRADIAYDQRPIVGERQCRASQRMILGASAPFPALRPARAAPSCAISAGLMLWHRDFLAPQAKALFGQEVREIENLGSYNCRSVAGSANMSQHSSANALDISAFILTDGTVISVKEDWDDAGKKGQFLRQVRDGACQIFATSLSPDYNEAHADHFHFDLADRPGNWRICS